MSGTRVAEGKQLHLLHRCQLSKFVNRFVFITAFIILHVVKADFYDEIISFASINAISS